MTVTNIEKYWPLSGISAKPLQTYDNRTVLSLTAREGRFVCKSTRGQFTNAEFRTRTSIFGFLENKEYAHAPKLLKTRTGADFVTDGDVRTVIMWRVEGETPRRTAENQAALGRALGKLNAISDYPHPALISVNAIRPHFPEIAAGLPSSIRDAYLTVAESLPDIDALPHSLIHFEASLKNSVRKPDGTIVLVDWDEAGTGATALDPGYHLINLFVSEDLRFDAAGAQAFYRVYLTEHRLSAEERAHLFDASLFHALRYVIWGDVEKRWQRILWAIENKRRLLAIIPTP